MTRKEALQGQHGHENMCVLNMGVGRCTLRYLQQKHSVPAQGISWVCADIVAAARQCLQKCATAIGCIPRHGSGSGAHLVVCIVCAAEQETGRAAKYMLASRQHKVSNGPSKQCSIQQLCLPQGLCREMPRACTDRAAVVAMQAECYPTCIQWLAAAMLEIAGQAVHELPSSIAG